MYRYLLLPLLALFAFNAVAEPCLDNFTSDGNLLTGRTYKTWALLPGVRQQDAYLRAYAFTTENGFTILSASKEAGAISASQSASFGRGKTVPLSITMTDDGIATRINLSYATSTGMMSPEDAIRRHFCLTVAAAGSGASSGNATREPTAASPPAPASTRGTARGYVEATPEQQLAARREVLKSLPNESVRRLASEAAPTISAFIERLACLAGYEGASALDEYAAPGAHLGLSYSGLRPMRFTQYHSKASCLTVLRVQGWKAPANNALQFEVIYKADDSGETAKTTHEMVKQPDGAWLFTQ